MAAFAWVMVGLAIWHFTIFLPDHFWGGIVGAFIGALLGSVFGGLLFHGLAVPSRADTSLLTALEGAPGAIVGMGLIWFLGRRAESADRGAAEAFGRAT
jgi:hypothetical protein